MVSSLFIARSAFFPFWFILYIRRFCLVLSVSINPVCVSNSTISYAIVLLRLVSDMISVIDACFFVLIKVNTSLRRTVLALLTMCFALYVVVIRMNALFGLKYFSSIAKARALI